MTAGTVGTQSIFTEPSTAPGIGTMHTLNDIMGVAPVVDDANGVQQAQVVTGTTYWSLCSGTWGTQTGTMPNNGTGSTIVPTTTNQSIAAGYWSSANTVQGDSDLVAGNIKSDVNLFGITGTLTAGSTYNAEVPKTGQTTSYATDDDGDLEKGVAWPNPRFTDNGDGTVTDNLTGLVWLKNAHCFGERSWTQALSDANGLASGSCGLSDGSSAGDWPLPNVRELQSLVDYGRASPALPSGHPFTDVESFFYWSSTTFRNYPTYAWYVSLDLGHVSHDYKGYDKYVWPVRGGR